MVYSRQRIQFQTKGPGFDSRFARRFVLSSSYDLDHEQRGLPIELIIYGANHYFHPENKPLA